MHENMLLNEEPTSLEHVKKSDVFPKKTLVSEDERLRVPFPLLSGESAEYLGRSTDGIVVLTNFRVLVRYVDSFINVPLGLIESVEIRDIFYLHIYCKDATAVRCPFSANDTCQDWFKRLSVKIAPCRKLDDTFAFAFHAWCIDRNRLESDTVLEGCYQLCPINKPKPYSFTAELERMKFDMKNAWRYAVNEDFSICSSYPKEHIIPKSVSEERLRKVADFRALQRFPSVVWRNCQNGAVLVRCGQPEIGWLGWRNTDDEKFLEAIPLACAMNPGTRKQNSDDDDRSSRSSLNDEDEEESTVIEEPKKMLIIDCRSYGAAFANRAKGGGVECPEYYPTCEIQFMNLANIHTVRKSFVALRQLCSNGPDQPSWLSNLDNTKWLQNMSSLMKAASIVVSSNDKEGRPVLVHCSDGWDRTPQIITLAELMLDPYYRTVEGFEVLIEREWLDFGHKFADRNGNGVHLEDVNERCPVFMQWLECVYQLVLQYPCEFQFNEAFLVKLVHHSYACLFGTFLCNTSQERIKQELDKQTASVWSLLQDKQFHNKLFSPSYDNQVLYPKCQVNSLQLWTSVYLSTNSSFASPDEVHPPNLPVPIAENGETVNLPKTRSCENLLSLTDHTASPSRRRSDPNITMELGEQTTKLLKDAMAGQDGDTSCSSESIRSSNNTSFSDNVSELVNGHDKESSPIQNSSNSDKALMNGNGVVMNGHASESEEEKDSVENAMKGDCVNGETCINGEIAVNDVNGFNETVNSENGHMTIENNINGHESQVNGSVEHLEGANGDAQNSDDDHVKNSHLISTNGAYSDCELSHVNVNLCNSIPNGGGDDQEIDQVASRNKLLQRTLSGDKVEPSLEGSTDTLIEDGSKDLQKDSSDHTLTPTNSFTSSKLYEVKSLKSLCDISRSTNKLNSSSEQTSSISTATSTSDLTDSRVGQDTNRLNGHLGHMFQNSGPCDTVHNSLKLKCILAQSVLPNGNVNGCGHHGVNGEQKDGIPSCSTSLSPQSRTSTCPPTPGTSDGKSIDTQVHRQQRGIGKHLDWDGLTRFKDPVQQQIDKIEQTYEEKMEALRNQLTQLQNLIAHTASACNGEVLCSHDFRKSEQESPGSCDLASIQSNYSNASDTSWDHMEDPEVHVQYWVPDHMVTHCAGCEIKFSMTVRKHHCRNCGKVFCNTCSSESMPLPHQMVHTPERVCGACYKNLSNLLTKSIIELESGQTMAAAASN